MTSYKEQTEHLKVLIEKIWEWVERSPYQAPEAYDISYRFSKKKVEEVLPKNVFTKRD